MLTNQDQDRDDERKIIATLITCGLSICIWLLYFNLRFSFNRSISTIVDAVEIGQVSIEISEDYSNVSNNFNADMTINSNSISDKNAEHQDFNDSIETQKAKSFSKNLGDSKN